MNCLLIEDEPLAMQRLKEYVMRIPFLKICHAIDNGWEALEILKNEPVDLIFLDIEMDAITGVQLLNLLPKRPPVILITAYDHYALKAFDLQVADYLLKPYTFDRFLQAVLRVQATSAEIKQTDRNQYIFVKSEYSLLKIMLDDILYIEGMRDYRRICTKEKKVMTPETFGHFENQLPANQFCRVHKSYMVAINKIESIERDRIKIHQALIPLSISYKEQFYTMIGR
jgi:two-component system, LytTR family, response regulator